MIVRSCALLLALTLAASATFAQVSTGSGTVTGTVTDPTGASVPGATVTIANPVSGYTRSVTTGDDGAFVFHNIPPNPYHLSVAAGGFNPNSQDVEVRTAVPVNAKVTLELAGATTSVNVEANSQDLVETVPSAHTDIDQSLFQKM